MTYIRKITALILSIIFLGACVLAGGIAMSIKNVNVEFMACSENYLDDYASTKENLNKLKGTILLFVSDEDINSSVSGNGICVAEYKKVFPCTLDITLKERVEVFAQETEDGFDFYDEDGKYMRSGKENVNPADDCPDVLISVDGVNISSVAKICSYFKSAFLHLRSIVERIEVDKNGNVIYFDLYSGLQVKIVNYDKFTQEKIQCAKEKYVTLTEAEKLSGRIEVALYGSDSKNIDVQYVA